MTNVWSDTDYIIETYSARIDDMCVDVYTSDASRDRRYKNKHDEAVEYRSHGYPTPVDPALYPTLAIEAPARAMTAQDLADLIIAKATAFRQLGALAKSCRARLNIEVASAQDPIAHAGSIIEPMETMISQLV